MVVSLPGRVPVESNESATPRDGGADDRRPEVALRRGFSPRQTGQVNGRIEDRRHGRLFAHAARRQRQTDTLQSGQGKILRETLHAARMRPADGRGWLQNFRARKSGALRIPRRGLRSGHRMDRGVLSRPGRQRIDPGARITRGQYKEIVECYTFKVVNFIEREANEMAYIIDAVRTPRGRGKMGKGALNNIHPHELLAQALNHLAERAGIDKGDVDDVVIGCVSQAGEQGGDIARMAALAADWPLEVTGVSLNRYCGSGLQAVNFAAMGVMSGMQRLVVGGGVESMSRVPMGSDGAGLDGNNPHLRKK